MKVLNQHDYTQALVPIRPGRNHYLLLHIFLFLVTEAFRMLTLTPTWKTDKGRLAMVDKSRQRPEAQLTHQCRQPSVGLLRTGRTSQNMGLSLFHLQVGSMKSLLCSHFHDNIPFQEILGKLKINSLNYIQLEGRDQSNQKSILCKSVLSKKFCIL